MTTMIDVRELAARLDEVLKLAASGNEVILTEGATPRAKLVPLVVPADRALGLHPRAMQPGEDFDDPLPDEFWLGGRP